MGVLQLFKDTYLWYRHHDGAKEFTVYVIFVIVFSIVAFASKPDVSQFWTNEFHTDIWASMDHDSHGGNGFLDVDSVDGVYEYINDYLMGEIMYPVEDDNGNILTKTERQTISGFGRVMGAHRLRQVRAKTTDCDIPEFLKDMYGDVVTCEDTFGIRSRDKEPFFEDKELGNMTLPFTWRSARELNTSLVYVEYGLFSPYSQDGFAVDFLPNIAPNVLAQYVEDCYPVLQRSVDQCILEQGVDLTPPSSPPPPAIPVIIPPPPGGAGLALKDTALGANLTTVLTIDKTLSAALAFDRVEFEVHNTGDIALEWAYDDASLRVNGEVPDWFTIPVLLNGNVAAGGSMLVQLSLQLPDQPGSSYQTLLAGGATGVVAPGNSPLQIQLRSEPDLLATVVINMQYDFGGAPAGNATGRRLLQQRADTTCQIIRDNPINTPKDPQGNEVLDLSRCVLLADDYTATPQEICHPTVRNMGFQLLLDMSSLEKCGGCCNAEDTDAVCNGLDEDYPGWGCLPSEIAAAQLDILRSSGWVDNGTRAIMFDTTLFNANSNLFTTIRNLFELPITGGVWPKGVVRTFKVYRYVTGADTIIMVLELIFCAMIVWYTIEEIVEINRQRWDYFKEAWNYMDWANLIIFYTVIGLRIASVLRVKGFDFESVTIDYVDFPVLGLFAVQELNVSALNFFLMYFKLFKYLSAVPRMDSILVTVSAASFDLGLFMIMAVLITFGFAAAFYVCFGATLFNYKTLGDCFGTLTRALLGDFDYAELSEANRVMAPVLFYAFFVMVFFVLLNMFLAIINDSYAEVKGNQSEEDLEFYANLRVKIKEKLSMLFNRKQNIHQIAQELMVSDSNMDDIIDEQELANALKDNPKAYEILQTTGAKDLLAKYDVSGDGVLDKAEMTAILRELAEKEADVQKEMDDEHTRAGGKAGGSRAAAGAGQVIAGNVKVDLAEVEARIDKVEGQIKEMSRNVAKKLSLMIDLMMSLSDQISNAAVQPRPAASAAGNQIMPAR